MNKTLKIVIYIIVLGLCLLGGWYIGGKFADKEDSVNTSSNTKVEGDINKCTKEELEYIEKLANENKGDFILSK